VENKNKPITTTAQKPNQAHFFSLLSQIETGHKIPKEDWDLEQIVLPVRERVERFEVTWPGDQVVNTDLALADRVFAAARDLLLQSGIYAVATGRVIPITERMLDDALHAVPQSLLIGEGLDAVRLVPRDICDDALPFVCGGNPGAPIPEDLFLPAVISWMQEPLVNMATCGSLSTMDGSEVPGGDVGEILATRRELLHLRHGLAQVGRPSMGLLGAQTSVTAMGDLAVANPAYLRPCDAHLVPLLNELMIDPVSLARVANSCDYGMHNASLATVMVGGLGGGPAGSAILQAASFMAANLVCLADYHLLHPIHIRHVATSTREVMWVQSVVTQAFARNAPCIILADIYPKSGAGTRELLYETAANALVATVSGAHLEGVGSADGMLPNCSGLEVRCMAEVGRAVAEKGVELGRANALALSLLEKYEYLFDEQKANPGKRFDQVYNLDTLQPTPEWHKLYLAVRSDLARMGVG
jgi:methylamine---corrinoid protein Co-methyltransferase